jgi:hypothetical protein
VRVTQGACNHRWLRFVVTEVSIDDKRPQKFPTALVPVSLCAKCHLTHICFGDMHLIGVLKHEQAPGEL